jgi:hypothetical protein
VYGERVYVCTAIEGLTLDAWHMQSDDHDRRPLGMSAT